MSYGMRAPRIPVPVAVPSALECPVCLTAYSPNVPDLLPRLLQCGHSVCTRDLQRLVSNQPVGQRVIECPLDRQLTSVPGGDVTKCLNVNFALVELLQTLGPSLVVDSRQRRLSTPAIRTAAIAAATTTPATGSGRPGNMSPRQTGGQTEDKGDDGPPPGLARHSTSELCQICHKLNATEICLNCTDDLPHKFCAPCGEREHQSPLGLRHRRVPYAPNRGANVGIYSSDRKGQLLCLPHGENKQLCPKCRRQALLSEYDSMDPVLSVMESPRALLVSSPRGRTNTNPPVPSSLPPISPRPRPSSSSISTARLASSTASASLPVSPRTAAATPTSPTAHLLSRDGSGLSVSEPLSPTSAQRAAAETVAIPANAAPSAPPLLA